MSALPPTEIRSIIPGYVSIVGAAVFRIHSATGR
jgi:hypothetical protein